MDIEALAAEDRKLWDDMGAAKPRRSTMPAPGAVHDLAGVEAVAKTLGTPLMPWQKWTIRIATERNADNPDQYKYRFVLVTVPRQAGKTTVSRVDLVYKALKRAGRKSFYTAQSGKDAGERWKDIVSGVEKSPLKRFSKIRLAAGTQALTFINNSSIRPFTPSAESLHGYTPHDVVLDEIFVWSAEEGKDLLGAIIPAQNTLPDRQVWLVSTMGHATSEFLDEWIQRGKEAISTGGDSLAMVDFGLADGLDPFDPENWDCHPALGHTITKDDIKLAAETLPRGEFERAYMNRKTLAADTFVPIETWDKLASPDQSPVKMKDTVISYDVAYGGDAAAVVAAWRDESKQINIKVVKQDAGSDWLEPYLIENIKPRSPRGFGADAVGDTRVIADQIGKKMRQTALTPRDYTTACIAFKNHIMQGTLTHDGSDALREAVAAAVTRPMGEGWAFSGAKSTGSIAALKAAVVAVKILESSQKISAPKIRA